MLQLENYIINAAGRALRIWQVINYIVEYDQSNVANLLY